MMVTLTFGLYANGLSSQSDDKLQISYDDEGDEGNTDPIGDVDAPDDDAPDDGGRGTAPGGLIEGIADGDDANLDDGYESTAYFLLFIEEQAQPPVARFAQRLNALLRHEAWSEEMVARIAGEDGAKWTLASLSTALVASLYSGAASHALVRVCVRSVQRTLFVRTYDSPAGTRALTVFVREMDGVAYCTGSAAEEEIHLSTAHVANVSMGCGHAPGTPEHDARVRAEIEGVLVHEAVHAFQANASGSAPGGLIEGIADAVRVAVRDRTSALAPRDGRWQEKMGLWSLYKSTSSPPLPYFRSLHFSITDSAAASSAAGDKAGPLVECTVLNDGAATNNTAVESSPYAPARLVRISASYLAALPAHLQRRELEGLTMHALGHVYVAGDVGVSPPHAGAAKLPRWRSGPLADAPDAVDGRTTLGRRFWNDGKVPGVDRRSDSNQMLAGLLLTLAILVCFREQIGKIESKPLLCSICVALIFHSLGSLAAVIIYRQMDGASFEKTVTLFDATFAPGYSSAIMFSALTFHTSYRSLILLLPQKQKWLWIISGAFASIEFAINIIDTHIFIRNLKATFGMKPDPTSQKLEFTILVYVCTLDTLFFVAGQVKIMTVMGELTKVKVTAAHYVDAAMRCICYSGSVFLFFITVAGSFFPTTQGEVFLSVSPCIAFMVLLTDVDRVRKLVSAMQASRQTNLLSFPQSQKTAAEVDQSRQGSLSI
ncbi:peptidase of plants and bacteria-domain-containing protein [Zopfochytrium polystomum]|nr:peptidase of plants and bacteria-domain-containing protein [Zopfochytrium polystomum]